MRKKSIELNDDLFQKKTKFWKMINLIASIICLLVCIVSITLNFIYTKLNSYVVITVAVIFSVLTLIAVFGLFFSRLQLHLLKKKFYGVEQENDE